MHRDKLDLGSIFVLVYTEWPWASCSVSSFVKLKLKYPVAFHEGEMRFTHLYIHNRGRIKFSGSSLVPGGCLVNVHFLSLLRRPTWFFFLSFFFFNLLLAALDLCCCAQAFSSFGVARSSSLLQYTGLSLWGLLLLWSMGSKACRFE